MNKKFIINIVWFLLIGLHSNGRNKIHAIYFVDTKDSKIGEFCKKDLENMQRFTLTIAEVLKYDFCPSVFVAGDFNESNMKHLADTLNSDDSDIIVLYISSHGESPSGSPDILHSYPNIKFKGGTSVPVYDVHKKLSSKKHAVLMTIVDACNILTPKPMEYNYNKSAWEYVYLQHFAPAETDIINDIFLKNKFDLITAACGPGQYSFTSKDGSVFTNAILDAIHFHTPDPSKRAIDLIMKKATYYTESNSKRMCNASGQLFEKGDLQKKGCNPYTPIWSLAP